MLHLIEGKLRFMAVPLFPRTLPVVPAEDTVTKIDETGPQNADASECGQEVKQRVHV